MFEYLFPKQRFLNAYKFNFETDFNKYVEIYMELNGETKNKILAPKTIIKFLWRYLRKL